MSSGNDRNNIAPIQSGIGAGFLKRLFGGKPFMHCVIELIKNCRDWGATLINVHTEDRPILVIVDNGDGMNQANRDAFASINSTTAHGSRQAGRFCTGTKQALYSQATKVQVRTATREDPDYVYIFSFTAESYEVLVLRSGTIVPQRVRKTGRSWPYKHSFGTEVTYQLKKPSRRGIYRGEKLASELSARLPWKFSDIVRVDSASLPPKQIVGQAYRSVIHHRQLGQVAVELYRPEKKRREEDLRLTAVEIGEVPMSNLNRVLGDLGRDLHPVFLLSEVCGTISVEYLRDYGNEDRFTLDAAIADDPRTRHFVKHLNDIAPEVQRRLKIEVKETAGEEGTEQEIREVTNRFTELYSNEADAPPTGGGDGESSNDWADEHSGGSSKPPIRLSYNREFEPGETITITASIRKDLAGSFSLKDIQWYVDRSRARNLSQIDQGISLEADELGHGVIHADIPGSSVSASAHYDIVATRVFRITVPNATIQVGSQLPIMTTNHDRVKGKIIWDLDGPGNLEPQGKRSIYTATSATRLGPAVVQAYDSAQPSMRASCDITVRDKPRNLVCIRGEWFEYQHVTAESAGESTRPVEMISGGDNVHRLYIKQRANGFAEAARQGILQMFLLHAIAAEFPSFALFELGESDIADLDPRDLPMIMAKLCNQQFEIVSELLDGSKSK